MSRNVDKTRCSACLAAIALGAMLLWTTVDAQTARSLRDGVFTKDQATRGKDRFESFCGTCHGADLSGGGAVGGDPPPPLKNPDLFAGRRDLSEFFVFMKGAMPLEAPSTLRDTTYADVLAYLLQQNGFPAGSEELKPDLDFLRMIDVDVRP